MFNDKFMTTLLAGGLLLAAQGCGTTVDDDDSASPTPTTTAPPATATATATAALPDALFFTESDIDVQCDAASWSMYSVVDGWTEDGTVEFGIFDYSEFCKSYGTPPGDCYREWHPVGSDGAYDDAGYYEELSVELDYTASANDVVEGVSSAFKCENKSFLTFAMCADDFWYATGTFCVFLGNEASYWETNADARIVAP